MTQDEVLKMAKQAGFSSAVGKHIALDDDLERFAKLVAQHERKRMAWTQGHWTEYEHNIASAEREECAKVAENTKAPFTATAIRARGQALDYEPWTPDDMAYRPNGLPQRTWVGLTDEEQQQAYEQWQNEGWGVFYQAIEAALKDKNNG